MRKILSVMMVFVIGLLMVSLVSAHEPEAEHSSVEDSRDHRFDLQDSIRLETIKINGDEVNAGVEALAVEEGETLRIRVGVKASSNVEDIEVEAKISGYEYSDYDRLSDSTHLDRMDADTTKYFNLEVTLPRNLENKVYWLRLRVMNGDSYSQEEFVELSVEPTRHALDVADVSFSPGNSVMAGRSLLTTVLLQNYGYLSSKDVKVTVAIPELGVSATEFVDVVKTDNHNVEYEDVPEMFLPIPASAAEGDYQVVVTVKYDDLRETVTESKTIHVTANDRFSQEDTLVLAVGPEIQNVGIGNTASYALALTNAGTGSKAYMLEVVTGDWAIASVSEALVVLESGANQVVTVNVAASANAAPGEHVASVVVKSGSEVLETIPLRANVVPSSSGAGNDGTLRNGLEIALIVLVVLLVIIGLIIGFSRLRKDDEDDEEQTYY